MRDIPPPPLHAEEEAREWPDWKVALAALWPVAIVAAYIGIAVLLLQLRLSR